MPRKADLVKFLNRETKSQGNISLAELARKLQDRGLDISVQKIWRWVRDENAFPDTEDLEKLATYKKLSLPDFLVIHLGYPKVSKIADISSCFHDLSVQELSEISAIAASILAEKLSSAVVSLPAEEVFEELPAYQGNGEVEGKVTLPQEYLSLLGQLLRRAVDYYGLTHQQTATKTELPSYIITALLSEPQGLSLAQEVFWKLVRFINGAIAASHKKGEVTLDHTAPPTEILLNLRKQLEGQLQVQSK